MQNQREMKPLSKLKKRELSLAAISAITGYPLTAEGQAELARRIEQLPERWRQVLEMRWGLTEAWPEPLALAAIAEQMDPPRTRQWVNKLETKILTRLYRQREAAAAQAEAEQNGGIP